jgi:two-component sensor histidine kinase
MVSRQVLPAPKVVTLTLVLHELATNAVMHGALSVTDGSVLVDCRDSKEDRGAVIGWVEHGGPTVSSPTERRGFRLRLLGCGLLGAAGMAADVSFAPEGLRCVVTLRVPAP